MRLKSLEIKGFKSFANNTILYFDENVTGVVGPNGSGKSNVVDAFRWVLGEQKSKELRLEQMADILFNGAEGKQQANAAEVSVTFDNTKNILPTEYNNVKITRRLYRSGDSEYCINDVNCRLKDIHTLLMDTGIGSNSYSIIELGMVDDILHDKENARRRMFEQAAGISKFKKRKKETFQKLKLTSADLERVEDVLFEIEKNLKDLEKQARRTKRYYEIRDKYKKASIELHQLKWNALGEASSNIEKQIEDSKLEYNQVRANLNQQEASLENEKRKNLTEERNLSDFQKNLNDLLDQIRQEENDKNLLGQKIAFSEENITKAKKLILTTDPLLEQSKIALSGIVDKRLQKEEAYKSGKILLDEAQEQVEKVNSAFIEHKGFQQEKVKNLQSFQSKIFELDKRNAVNQNKLESLDREINQNSQQCEQIKNGISGQHIDLDQYLSKINILEQEIEVLNSKENGRKKALEDLEIRINKTKDKKAKISRTIDALDNEHSLLASMVANMEGFPESVKFLHNNWNAKKTLLSDVINTAEEYRAAVEQFLHPYLSYFVVENLQEANSAIEMLKVQQKGKAQFFLLDQVEIKQSIQNIGLLELSSVIEVEEKYSELIKMICHNVCLASDEQIFNQSVLDDFPELTLLNSNGSIIRNKSSIAGGSIGLFEGKKIGRKKRIEHLKSQISKERTNLYKCNEKLEQHQGELLELKSAKYDHEIKAKDREKANSEKHALVLKSKLEAADSNISRLLNRNSEIEKQKAELQVILVGFQNEKEVIEVEASKLKDELSNQDATIAALNEKLSVSRDVYNERNISLIQIENFLLSLDKDVEYQKSKQRDLNQTLFDSKKMLNEHIKELEKSKHKISEVEVLLTESYEKRSGQQLRLSEAEQEYFKARAKVNEIEDHIRKVSSKINDMQFLINQMKDKQIDFKFKRNSIKERIQIEFSIDIEELLREVADPAKGEAELEMEVEKYKRRLDNYGEINPLALEAYDEMQERFVHIKEQRDDILEAKTSLMKTIEEIEQTATKLFLKSFEEVRKHFVVVFRSLFTQDDDCDLLLENPDDPLNSKIEIIAKPKGKRPISLSQLSGGEKTLTATALLFSLYLLKPAPFCIFDEVDAPLDDTNIQKFANIIRAFADKSQFIIVTHNKSTMAEVDVLYGVYMQKKGISSVSAVDFRSYEDKGVLESANHSTY